MTQKTTRVHELVPGDVVQLSATKKNNLIVWKNIDVGSRIETILVSIDGSHWFTIIDVNTTNRVQYIQVLCCMGVGFITTINVNQKIYHKRLIHHGMDF